MTKYERIKSMTIDEMAEYIESTPSINSCEFCIHNGDDCSIISCVNGVKDFLESEAK